MNLFSTFVETLKQNKMLELIIGAILYYMILKIDEHRKVLNRVKDAKEKLFTNDRPTYENI